MKLANRCPSCGGVAKHTITDIKGKNYYHCNAGLTSHINERGELTRSGNIIPCDTVIDEEGKLVTGTIAYKNGRNVGTMGITEGKIRR